VPSWLNESVEASGGNANEGRSRIYSVAFPLATETETMERRDAWEIKRRCLAEVKPVERA
jgi:hypothetical protein